MNEQDLEEANKHYAKDQDYWNKYIKGRPQIPASLFERVVKYHVSHGGQFGKVHDVGGGVGVHSEQLAKIFEHVILSDVVGSNLDIAKSRLGTGHIFSFKAIGVDDADALPKESLDMIFAANMIHFAKYDHAFPAFHKHLKPGGTLAVVAYGVAVLRDPQVDKIWRQIWLDGLRVLQCHAKDPQARLLNFWKSACTSYDNVPLSEEYFEPGAMRIKLNCMAGWPKMMPPDLEEECAKQFGTNTAIGKNDKIVMEADGDWTFKTDVHGLHDQFNGYPFASLERKRFAPHLKQLDDIVGSGTVEGVWPAVLLLATRVS